MNNTTKSDALASAMLSLFMALLAVASMETRFFLPLAAITIISVIVTIVVTGKVKH